MNDEYTLTAPQKPKKKGDGNASTSQIMNSSSIENKQEFPWWFLLVMWYNLINMAESSG